MNLRTSTEAEPSRETTTGKVNNNYQTLTGSLAKEATEEAAF